MAPLPRPRPLSAHDHYDFVTTFQYLFGFEAEGRPGLRRLLPVPAKPFVAAVRSRIQLTTGNAVELALGVPLSDETRVVVCVESIESAPHDLHVLLRHRPRSIS